MFVAAWRAQPGCEATVLSNWTLRRDDQIGCPTFAPIDEVDARLAARSRRHRAPGPVGRALKPVRKHENDDAMNTNTETEMKPEPAPAEGTPY
jgi:hypothetical protein